MRLVKNRATVVAVALLSFILTTLSITQILNVAVWRDEAFTLQLLQHPVKEIISLTAQDVHPPLYYLLVKPFQLLAGNHFVLEIHLIRFVSILPIFLIIGILYKYFKNKGKASWSAAIFALFFLCMPHVLLSASDLRMYGFSQLFLLLGFLSMEDFLVTYSLRSLAFASFASLLCLYTNYFAGLGACALFLFAIIVLVKRKLKKQCIQVLGFGFGICILYLPWLLMLMRQIATIQQQGFWIPPLSVRDYALSVLYLLSPADGNMTNTVAIVLLMTSFLFFSVLSCYIYRAKSSHINGWQFGLFVPLLLLIIGLGVSVLTKPIFLPRYLIVTSPIFYLTLLKVLFEMKGEKFFGKVKIIALVFLGMNLLYTSMVDAMQFASSQRMEKIIQTAELQSYPVLSDSTVSARLASIYSNEVIENHKQSQLTEAVYHNFLRTKHYPKALYYFSPTKKTKDKNELKLRADGYREKKEFTLRFNSENEYSYKLYVKQ